jgi:hypothetical protein
VRIGGNILFQFPTSDEEKSIVKNHDRAQALAKMERALRYGFHAVPTSGCGA